MRKVLCKPPESGKIKITDLTSGNVIFLKDNEIGIKNGTFMTQRTVL